MRKGPAQSADGAGDALSRAEMTADDDLGADMERRLDVAHAALHEIRPKTALVRVAEGRNDENESQRWLGWRIWPVVRFVAAIAIVGIVGRSMVLWTVVPSSDEAVVQAEVATIRATHSGVCVELTARVGQRVEAGQVLGRVHDAIADPTSVRGLRLRGDECDAELRRLREEVEAGARVDADLRALLAQYRKASLEGLVAGREEAEHRLRQAKAMYESARNHSRRSDELAAQNVLSAVEREAAADRVRELEHRIGELQASLVKLGVQIKAAEAGIVLETLPLEQRSWDISLQMLTLRAEITKLEHVRATVQTELAAEQRRLALLSDSEVRAARAGVVWRVAAMPGGVVSRGEMLAEVAEGPFVEARLARRFVPHAKEGCRARIDLGGGAWAQGTVRGIRNAGTGMAETTLAVRLTPVESGQVLVQIELDDPAPAAGRIGHPARVVIQPQGSGLRRWLAAMVSWW